MSLSAFFRESKHIPEDVLKRARKRGCKYAISTFLFIFIAYTMTFLKLGFNELIVMVSKDPLGFFFVAVPGYFGIPTFIAYMIPIWHEIETRLKGQLLKASHDENLELPDETVEHTYYSDNHMIESAYEFNNYYRDSNF